MTYGSEFARNNVTTTRNYKDPVFFDKKNSPGTPYSELNRVIVPSPNLIRNAQMEALRTIQKNALNNRMKQNESLNKLFTSGDVNSLQNFYLEGQEATLGDAITKIVNLVHGISLAPNKQPKASNAESTYKNWNTKFQHLYNVLESIQNQLSINSVTYQSYLDSLKTAMKACELGDLGIPQLKKWANQAYQLQGDTVEIIGTAWLNAKKIPNIETITLGNVALRGEVSTGRHTGQLIQDLITVNYEGLDLSNIPISYTIAGSGETIDTTLDQFFKALNKASTDKNERIEIDDNAYDVLLGLSALNTQAKSGKNQLPWNVALKSKVASTSVSIGEFGPVASGIGIVRAFQLLHTLNLDEDLDIADQSADYNALANYGLSTMLAKVLHLSEKEGNQMLLTPSGFISYVDRMEQLFKDGNDYVCFVENITLNSDTLGTSYHTTIASKPGGY